MVGGHCPPFCLLFWSEHAEFPRAINKTQSLQKQDTAPLSHPNQRERAGPSPQVGKLRHSCTSPSCCLHQTLSFPRQGTAGTLSPTAAPGVAHTSLGRGCIAGAQLGWGQRWRELYLQAGMRGQAGTALYQVTGRALEAGQGDNLPSSLTQAAQQLVPVPPQLLPRLSYGAGMLQE